MRWVGGPTEPRRDRQAIRTAVASLEDEDGVISAGSAVYGRGSISRPVELGGLVIGARYGPREAIGPASDGLVMKRAPRR